MWLETKGYCFNHISYSNFRILEECFFDFMIKIFYLWITYKGYFPSGNIIACSWRNNNLRLERGDHFSESRILSMPFWHRTWRRFVRAVSPCTSGISHYRHLIPSLTLIHPIPWEAMGRGFDSLANSIFPTVREKPDAGLWVNILFFSINWWICLDLKGWLDINI